MRSRVFNENKPPFITDDGAALFNELKAKKKITKETKIKKIENIWKLSIKIMDEIDSLIIDIGHEDQYIYSNDTISMHEEEYKSLVIQLGCLEDCIQKYKDKVL